MYRVLLVDDDMIVHMFLKDAFDWAAYDFTVAGDARDGKEALDVFHQIHPDLVLTDISMPRINGIELIRQLRQEEAFDGAIIALSCYDDRAFIHRAMQNGADEYILKNHLSEQSMDAIMQKIRNRVIARPVCEQNNQPSLPAHDSEQVRRELLEYILSGGTDIAVLEDMLQRAGLSSPYRRTATMLIVPVNADEGQTKALYDLASRRILDERCVFFYTSSNRFALLVNFSRTPSTSDALTALHTWQNIIQELAKQYFNLSVSFFASSICEGVRSVIDAFRQSHSMLPYGFYGSGYWQHGMQPALCDTSPPEAEQFLHNIPNLLRQAPEQLNTAYVHALRTFERYKVHPGILLSWLRRCDHTAGIVRSETEYGMLLHFTDYLSLAQAYVTQTDFDIPAEASQTMRMVVKYIHEHYREPIGLGHAARYVNLSPAYLSSLFKQEMGINFSKYLIQVRITQVQQQLLCSTQTIKKLAEDAGFHDYQYFCKAFKREIGISPTEFRKKQVVPPDSLQTSVN